ncbi:MAG: bifunctional hydroxymethylpyrimidine kinase/phosphomethylpyrimidine kinase [Wolbachia sp.]
MPLESIEEQLAAIFEDITSDVVKIEMLFSSEVSELVSEYILKYTIKH